MKMLDLFSGIGGFHLAAEWVWGDELEVVAHCEIDEYCQKVLKKHWPDVPIHADIKTLRGDRFGTVELVTGGFPCQPFSSAGVRKGEKDDRYLWSEMCRVVSESRPAFVIVENVVGLLRLGIDKVLFDLEAEGYTTRPFIIPACGKNASHRRDRLWVLAYSESYRNIGKPDKVGRKKEKAQELRVQFSDKGFNGEQVDEGEFESSICRTVDGLSSKLDKDRVKSLGNAIVPQVVVPFMQLIKQVELERKEASACKAVL